MTCPFKVGDRVHRLTCTALSSRYDEPSFREPEWAYDSSQPDATVTAITARGFTYRYDHPIQFVRPDWGTTQEGEVYEEGFQFWRKVD
jgi:hypothetical protein